MNYLLIVNNNNTMSWYVCQTRGEVITTLRAKHSKLLSECHNVSRIPAQSALLFEIEPNYEMLSIFISPPVEPIIKISG